MVYLQFALLLLNSGAWYNSPFIVPVAGCALAGCITVAGIWSGVRTREMKSQERLAMIAQGLPPEPDWGPEMLKQGVAPVLPPSGRPNDGSGARRAGLVLSSIGVGLIAFFVALAIVVRVREVLSGSAVGLIPLAIGIGFLADAAFRRREYDRWFASAPPQGPAFSATAPSEGKAPAPPPPGMTPAQASDWRPLH